MTENAKKIRDARLAGFEFFADVGKGKLLKDWVEYLHEQGIETLVICGLLYVRGQ